MQGYKEIAPLFSVANSKQEFYALLITKGGVRSDVGSEKHAQVPINSILCTGKILTGRTLYNNLGVWGPGFPDVASLVMYCIDATQRIVTKFQYRTAPLFSIINGWMRLSSKRVKEVV